VDPQRPEEVDRQLSWCDISIIWARDLADNQVKAFIVETKPPLASR